MRILRITIATLAAATILAAPTAAEARDSGWNGTVACAHC